MSGFGLMMFLKALVLTLWSALVAAWARYKQRRRARGIELRLDRKTGVYVAHDPIERLERGVRIGLCVLTPIVAAYVGFVVYEFLRY